MNATGSIQTLTPWMRLKNKALNPDTHLLHALSATTRKLVEQKIYTFLLVYSGDTNPRGFFHRSDKVSPGASDENKRESCLGSSSSSRSGQRKCVISEHEVLSLQTPGWV